MEKITDHQQERPFVGNLLVATAAAGSAVMDTFLNWLLAGVGAVLGLTISSMHAVASFVDPAAVKKAAFVFLFAAAVAAVAKILAACIRAGEMGRVSASDLMQQSSFPANFDFGWAMEHYKSALMRPWSWMVNRAISKMENGDLSASGRSLMWAAQVQTLFALLTIALLGCSLTILVGGLQSGS